MKDDDSITTDTARTLTPMQIAAQQRGARVLAPGVWIDRDGGIHISVPDVMSFFGIPDTPENRADATRLAEEAIRRANPTTPIIHQHEES